MADCVCHFCCCVTVCLHSLFSNFVGNACFVMSAVGMGVVLGLVSADSLASLVQSITCVAMSVCRFTGERGPDTNTV